MSSQAIAIEVTTRTVPAQGVAAVRRHTTMGAIGSDVRDAFRKIATAMEVAGAHATGPPVLVFLGRIDDWTGGDFELCFPVAEPFAGVDDVFGRELAGGPMACAVHRGPYEHVGEAYATIIRWMEEHGEQPAGPPREVYLNDPEWTKPEDLLTEIQFPIS